MRKFKYLLIFTIIFLLKFSFSNGNLTCSDGKEPISSVFIDGIVHTACCDPKTTTCVYDEKCYSVNTPKNPRFLCYNNKWYLCSESNSAPFIFEDMYICNNNKWNLIDENTFRCEDKSSFCGSPCESQCLDESFLDKLVDLIGGTDNKPPYNQKAPTTPFSGKCIDGFCIDVGCTYSYTYDTDCFSSSKDEDIDGVPDKYDSCPGTPTNHEVDEEGCSLRDFTLLNRCNHVYGEGSNLNIVITACGWEKYEKPVFEYWAKKIAEGISKVEPYKSYKDKYSIFYVWTFQKSDNKGFKIDETTGLSVEDSTKKCFESNELTKAIVSETCELNENLVILDIAHNSGEATSSYSHQFAVVGQGVPWCCDMSGTCCSGYAEDTKKGYSFGSWDKDVVFTALHESGHLFKTWHSSGWKIPPSAVPKQAQDTNNDYYSPSIYPISSQNYLSEPCPIWDFPEYKKWAKINKQAIGCFPGYSEWDSFLYTYSPLDEFTIMSGNRNPPFKYDPVTTKLIEDALLNGYDDYLELEYPHKCEEIDNQEKREECLIKACNYIDDSFEKEKCCLGDPQNMGISPTLDNNQENSKYNLCISN